MRKIIYLAGLLIAVGCLAMGTHPAPAPAPTAPTILYRIRVEEGIKAPEGVPLTDAEEKAIKKLNNLLVQWPRMVWIGSHDGQLVIVKMGPDGKPMKAVKP